MKSWVCGAWGRLSSCCLASASPRICPPPAPPRPPDPSIHPSTPPTNQPNKNPRTLHVLAEDPAAVRPRQERGIQRQKRHMLRAGLLLSSSLPEAAPHVALQDREDALLHLGGLLVEGAAAWGVVWRGVAGLGVCWGCMRMRERMCVCVITSVPVLLPACGPLESHTHTHRQKTTPHGKTQKPNTPPG